MNESFIFLLAFVAGLVLGAIFFGGLWWTVRAGVTSRRPALWLFPSLVLRMSIALAGFYWVGRGHGGRLLVCLLGFVTARLLVTWLTRTLADDRTRQTQEAGHALKSR